VSDTPTQAEPARRPGNLAFAMRALGRDEPPRAFVLGGRRYTRSRVVKHDFWAATAFYADDTGAPVAVAKVNRREPFLGLPLAWIGRFLCRREMRFYATLADVRNVPALLGRLGETGFVHGYAPGRPLRRNDRVSDAFFPDLHALFAELHRRDIAYVDANKPENILLGDDGTPHLIDFQISYDLHELGDNRLNRAVLRRMQDEDIYHLLKHKKRLRPDQLTPGEFERVMRKSWFIRAHRWLTRPYFLIRRRAMRRLREAGKLLPEGSK
jgi:hypothetical protein